MQKNIFKAVFFLFFILFTACGRLFFAEAKEAVLAENVGDQEVAAIEVEASGLHAKSAVLMDAVSGRVLYEKNGQEFLANASTTKILTCILALEEGKGEDVVQVSAYAASMPDVQLNIRKGEQYRLGDLLYSLMLESHNDSAVAIAEHIAGSCEAFSQKMNKKAQEIGCRNTYFLTPNGLDAKETITTENGEQIIREHGTTATDLALLMRYCIQQSPQREAFLQLTRTPAYSFCNKIEAEDGTLKNGSRSFSCNNHNSFLQMMEGALTGKTGFTGKAGYCYVGALRQGERTYIVALLACGWPGNRTYKWQDTRKLMEYGLKAYQFHSLDELNMDWDEILAATVQDGQGKRIGESVQTILDREQAVNIPGILLKGDEKLSVKIEKASLKAPLKKGQPAGRIIYQINAREWMSERLKLKENIAEIDFLWCVFQCLDLLWI